MYTMSPSVFQAIPRGAYPFCPRRASEIPSIQNLDGLNALCRNSRKINESCRYFNTICIEAHCLDLCSCLVSINHLGYSTRCVSKEAFPHFELGVNVPSFDLFVSFPSFDVCMTFSEVVGWDDELMTWDLPVLITMTNGDLLRLNACAVSVLDVWCFWLSRTTSM